jgi:hypothetical protein
MVPTHKQEVNSPTWNQNVTAKAEAPSIAESATRTPSPTPAGTPSQTPPQTPPRSLFDLPVRRASVGSTTQSPIAVDARTALESARQSPTGSATDLRELPQPSSHAASADTRSDGTRQASGAQTQNRSLFSRLTPHPQVAPAIETGASFFAIASAFVPSQAKALNGTSGVGWAGANLVGIAANKQHDKIGYLTSGLGFIAGTAQTVGQFVSGQGKHAADGISEIAWGAGGGAKMAKAAHGLVKGKGHVAVHVADGLSGAFNIAAAASGGVGTVVAGTPAARVATVASGFFWAAASGMDHVKQYAKQRYEPTIAPVSNSRASSRPPTPPAIRSTTPPAATAGDTPKRRTPSPRRRTSEDRGIE